MKAAKIKTFKTLILIETKRKPFKIKKLIVLTSLVKKAKCQCYTTTTIQIDDDNECRSIHILILQMILIDEEIKIEKVIFVQNY